MYKILFSLIIALFIGINIAYAQGLDWIPDPNLRKAVREEIGVPEGVPITPEDIAKVVRLNAASMDITDLTGLERFINLQNIVADHNHIQDLRPLANLTNLGDLHLNYNNIQGPSPACGIDKSYSLDIKLQHYFRYIALGGIDKSHSLDTKSQHYFRCIALGRTGQS